MRYTFRCATTVIFLSGFGVGVCGQQSVPTAAADGTVPSVVGRLAQDAKSTLTDAGLLVKFQLGQPAPSEKQALTVFRQSPAAGAKIPADKRVELTIYGRAAIAPKPGVVPALVGLTADRAKRALRESQLGVRFRLGRVAQEEGQGLQVYAQNPEPGGKLETGAVVEVTIYEPPISARRSGGQELVQVASIPFLDQSSEIVEPRSGLLLIEVTDLSVPIGRTRLEIRRFLQMQGKPPGLLGTRWRMNWEKRVLRSRELAVIEEGMGTTLFRFNDSRRRFASAAGDILRFTERSAVCIRADGTQERYGADGRLVEVLRGNGNRIRLRYDVDGRLVQIEGPFDTFLRLISDRRGRVIRVESSTGARVTYAYESQQPVRGQDDGSLSLAYDYSAQGQLVRIKHPYAGEDHYTYDHKGRVTSCRRADGAVERFQFNDVARASRYIDPLGRTTVIQPSSDGMVTRVTDAAKQVSHIEYDLAGRPTTIIGPTRESLRLRYDSLGRLQSVQNSVTGETRLEYDGDSHKPVAHINQRSQREELRYDEHGNIVHWASAVGEDSSAEIEYDSNGLARKIESHDGQAVSMSYDEHGHLATLTDAGGKTWKTQYDLQGNLLRSTDPLGNVTEWEYDQHGRVTQITEPEGETTRFEYSPAGLLLRRVDHKDRATNFEYDERGRLVAVIDFTGRAARYEYFADSRIRSVSDERGIVAKFTYDALGRLVQEEHPGGRTISYRYDKLGNPIRWEDSLGASRTLRYDSKGRLSSVTNSLDETVRISRSEDRRTVQITNAAGQIKRLSYDESDQLVEVVEPAGDKARYEYDRLGQLTAVHHPSGGQSKYTYDAHGNITSVIGPRGKPSVSRYDEFGRLASVTDAKGQTTEFEYDKLSRLVRKTLADDTVIRYEYDDGNLILVDDGQFPVHYEYDASGNTTSLSYPAIKRKLTYEYDDAGRLTKYTDSEGHEFAYRYDDLDRLAAITFGDNQSISYTYDQAGRYASVRYPNGVSAQWEYDSESRPSKFRHGNATGETIAGWSVSYDELGNPSRIVSDEGNETRYGYDASGQLTEEVNAAGERSDYTYLPGGNRGIYQTGQEKIEYEYDSSDRVSTAGDESFVHDENGNLIERREPQSVTRYEYDAQDQLSTVRLSSGEVVQYGYAPTGERIWRKDSDGTTYFVTDGLHVTAELDENFRPKASYLHGPGIDHPLMMVRDGNPYYFHADRLGSVSRVTDATGAMVASYEYDAFGKIVSKTGSIASPFTYSAREFDEATGLYYYRARYYDPRLGRFLSVDPEAAHPERPLTLNPYQFALNNPARYVDPMGTDSIHPWLLSDPPASPSFRGRARGRARQVARETLAALTPPSSPSLRGRAAQIGRERLGDLLVRPTSPSGRARAVQNARERLGELLVRPTSPSARARALQEARGLAANVRARH
ncbi:MAG: RHS repeat-associated core domain-containing protein [Pirellulales bacterium]